LFSAACSKTVYTFKKMVVTVLYSCENIGDKSKYLSMQLEVHS
jgi:hypothetical protein